MYRIVDRNRHHRHDHNLEQEIGRLVHRHRRCALRLRHRLRGIAAVVADRTRKSLMKFFKFRPLIRSIYYFPLP